MFNRRQILQQAAVALGLGTSRRRAVAASHALDAAFDATTVAAAWRALGIVQPGSVAGLELQALDLVEDGATVEVRALSPFAGAQRLVLLVARNPNPLAAVFDLEARVLPDLTLRLKVAESCDLQLVAMRSDGASRLAVKPVAVTIGGCGEGEVATDLPDPSAAPQATRLRAQQQGDEISVRLLMNHPMETGLRQNARGRPVPAWTIHDAEASLNGAPLLTAYFGTGVSRNPYLRFALRGGRVGDTLGFSWTDTRGRRRDDRTPVLGASVS